MTDAELLTNLKGKTIEYVTANFKDDELQDTTLHFTDGTQITVGYESYNYGDIILLTLKN